MKLARSPARAYPQKPMKAVSRLMDARKTDVYAHVLRARPRVFPFAVFLAPLAFGLLVGCAHTESAQDRQMTQLREGLVRVQADHDRFDQRLNSMEVQMSEEHASPPPNKSASSARTPDLRVVHLSPDGAEQIQASSETAGTLNGMDPEDTSARPSIRVTGGQARPGRRGAPGIREQHIEETLPDEATNGGSSGPPIQSNAPRPAALDLEAKRTYDAALSLVNQKQFNQALEAFAAFLVKWPDHPNADNAMYWRGECYFAQGEFSRAAEQFDGVIARFPLGNKVPDALLKLGLSQQKLGNAQKAQLQFDRLQREFPRSEAVRRIPNSSDTPAPRREVNR